MKYILIADASADFRTNFARYLRAELKRDGRDSFEVFVATLEAAITFRTPANKHADLTILGGKNGDSPYDGPAMAAAIHLDEPSAPILILGMYAPDPQFALRAKRARAQVMDKNWPTDAIVGRIRSMLTNKGSFEIPPPG